jgi:RNA polymerase sigma-70 factor (ECF subfamily)
MSTTSLIKPPAPSGVDHPPTFGGRAALRLVGGAAPSAPADRGGEMSDADAASFQAVRSRLFGIAYRVLGDATEADDVVQDAWIRWQTTDRSDVRDAAAFLATTTRHLAIHVIQSARARRETSVGPQLVEAVDLGTDPARDVERREALEIAIRSLLEKLLPTERAAYLLREAFDYSYRELADVLGLSEPNARQIVTRARRRLSGEPRRRVGAAEQERLVNGFMAAAQAGDLATLEGLLSAGADDRVAA